MTLALPLPSTQRADSLNVVVTNRWEDVRLCLSLIHDGYVEAGFAEPNSTGLRVIPEYLNPGTIFFLCRDGDEPVGTMAWVPDGPEGVPSDRAFRDDVDRLRKTRHVTETTSLTIQRDARRMTRHIALRLYGAALQVLDRIDLLLACVMPSSAHFYGEILKFEVEAECDDLLGAPASLLSVPGSILKTLGPNPSPAPQCRALAALVNNPGPWFRNNISDRPWPPRPLSDLAVRLETIL